MRAHGHTVALLTAALFLGCQGDGHHRQGHPVPPVPPTRQQPPPAPPPPSHTTRTVISHITVSGNTMRYDVTTIRARPGQRVIVILTNKPPGALSHNWVLVKPGTEAAVAAAGLSRGLQNGYLAQGPNVLAHTPMIPPGKTTRTAFNAPSTPGDYPYICTFPGHYIMMHGILRVRP